MPRINFILKSLNRLAELIHLFDPFYMPVTLKRGVEPRIHDTYGQILTHQSRAHGNNVGIVVLFGEAGALLTPAHGTTNAADFIRCDGFAVSAAA